MKRSRHTRRSVGGWNSRGAAWVLAALLVALETGLAPAFGEDSTQAARPYPEGITCVWIPSLNSQYYSLIDDEHLVIQASGAKYYLITLTRRCYDLDTTLDIGVSAKGDQLCTGDSIVTDNDRCTIRYLEPVAGFKDAQSVVAGRKAEKKKSD